MIRVLHITGNLSFAGLEAVVMNYYRHMDTSKVQFDFVVGAVNKQLYDEEILERGGVIYRIPGRNRNTAGYIRKLRKIIEQNQYQIVHIHRNSASMAIDALAVKLAKVPVIIGHSHNTSCVVKWQHYLMKPFVNRLVDYRFGCSEEAGRWIFGNRNDIQIIHNAIDSKKYCFNEKIRNKYREDFGISNQFVVGFVGRLHEQKNCKRLLEIFKAVLSIQPNAVLVMAGDGPQKGELIEYAKILHIADKVIFMGRREDISNVLMMYDVLIMPSLYEGLPVVEVEAQASGLRCIVSDCVPLIDLTKRVQQVSLGQSDEIWADTILKEDRFNRKMAVQMVEEGQYDLAVEAKKLQEFYESISGIQER